jgi:hypothetical protein
MIYASAKPLPVIIMKDLSADGFSSIQQPLENIRDVKLIVQRLVQFHAASYYLAEEVGV